MRFRIVLKFCFQFCLQFLIAHTAKYRLVCLYLSIKSNRFTSSIRSHKYAKLGSTALDSIIVWNPVSNIKLIPTSCLISVRIMNFRSFNESLFLSILMNLLTEDSASILLLLLCSHGMVYHGRRTALKSLRPNS